MKHLLFALLFAAAPVMAEETQGTLLLLHSDDFAGKKSGEQWVLKEDSGKRTFVDLPAGERHQSGRRVKLEGERKGGRFKVQRTTVIGAAAAPEMLASYGASGTQQALFILTRFTDSPAWAITPADIKSSADGISSFLRTASFGQLDLRISVTPFFDTGVSTGNCNASTIQTAAETAAKNAGYILTNYRFLVYVFPRVACGWVGMAYVGSSGAWINGQWAPPTYEHELGHNLGLLHGGSASCLGGATCNIQEYGDPYNAMGASQGQYAAEQKATLGWTTNVATYTGPAATSYLLSAADVYPAGPNLVAVKVPSPLSTRTYWIEYRRNGGIQVRVSKPFERTVGADDTEIVLKAGGTTDNIPIGGTYTDATYALAFSVVAADGSTATITVGPTGAPPPPPPPTPTCTCP